MNAKLSYELLASKNRWENIKDAIKLGVFGNENNEIINNLKRYNIAQDKKIEPICNQIQKELKHGNNKI